MGLIDAVKNLFLSSVVEGVPLFLSQIWLRGVRAIQGFEKNEFGKVILVGLGARVCHVLLHSIYFNWILASEDNGRAILIV